MSAVASMPKALAAAPLYVSDGSHVSPLKARENAGEITVEPLLTENKHRFVLFPIRHNKVSVTRRDCLVWLPGVEPAHQARWRVSCGALVKAVGAYRAAAWDYILAPRRIVCVVVCLCRLLRRIDAFSCAVWHAFDVASWWRQFGHPNRPLRFARSGCA
jgi:hypothetical protein